ncbi:hypothetical protein SAMN05421507_111206 [Lentzea jiangxiensis]|uniref:Uncharacterized protein n=1 Tax=Lentzea jiangxiensis TaxID=641025 RepID=A0A1H0UA79_9PSEU|nr:hypothetical protein SAMN05421507_111206 [Lentzea jiangxiensis]
MGSGGADLLITAARAASRNGLHVVSMYLEKAAIEHQRNGCPAEVGHCAHEIEAARVLLSGF